MQETWFSPWVRKINPLEKEMVTHSSILAWEILWTETGGLQSMGSQRVRQNLVTKQPTTTTYTCVCAQECRTLWNTMDYNPPVSSVQRISQARILEWVAISYSRGSSQPRYWTLISCISYIGSLPLSNPGSIYIYFIQESLSIYLSIYLFFFPQAGI